MSFHHDLPTWRAMCSPDGCPVCRGDASPSDLVTIVETSTTWLMAQPTVCLRGTCFLLAKPHAVELHDLCESDLLSFMKDVQSAARALLRVTGAVKINYEIHGNTVPHLHLHLFPRYMDDPFPGAPIDYRRTKPPVYEAGEFERFVADLRESLSRRDESPAGRRG